MLSDPWYLEVGESITDSLNLYTKVDGGFASVRDVSTMVLEDHQHSFFLSETYASTLSHLFNIEEILLIQTKQIPDEFFPHLYADANTCIFFTMTHF